MKKGRLRLMTVGWLPEFTLTPDRVVMLLSREEVPPVEALVPLSHITLPIKVIEPAPSEERCGSHPHQVQPSHQRQWVHIVYIGGLQPKSSTS